jgi:hypothetical protein
MTITHFRKRSYRLWSLILVICGPFVISACGRDETDTVPVASSTTPSVTTPSASTSTAQSSTSTTTAAQPKPSGADANVRVCIKTWNRTNPGRQLVKEMSKSGTVYVSVVSIAHQSPPTGPGDCRMDFALAAKGPTGRAGSYTTDASGKWCCFDNTVTKVSDLTSAQQKWNAHTNANGRVALGAPQK